MNPYPKPEKAEKKKMSSKEFRKKYTKNDIKSKKDKWKSKTTPQQRFYNSPAWKWFSRYMKLAYCDDQGLVWCATSGVPMMISDPQIHLGHCIRVFEGNNTHMSTAFSEDNVLPQSYRENRFFGGRPEIMRDRIDQIHGEGTYNDLLIQSKQFKKYTDGELKAIAKEYRELTYQMLAKKRIKKWWK